jgi:5,10-methylene-tetrahydrofolate dehydrogenase/methenyl tetrahydrofolate cyclohydrolase
MILNGSELSKKIKDDLKIKIDKLDTKPGLGIILIGDNIESKIYVEMKKKTCSELNINIEYYKFPIDVEQGIILETIKNMNDNKSIHGILIQLPLPNHLNTNLILNTVSHEKDVDGFHTINAGKLFQNRDSTSIPCTPLGCLELLDHYNINVKSMNAVIIGCSNIVGLPLSMLLLHRGATITICHIDTKNTKELVQKADLIVSCCGVPHLVKEDWVKKNAIIIDIGINKLNDSKKGYRLVGDVDYENVKNKCSYITPVPGGVGPMTVAMLMKNVYNLSLI